MPSIHSSLVRAFGHLGVSVTEISATHALGSSSNFLLGWPKGKGLEAVLALDMGAEPALAHRVRDLQTQMSVPWIIWFLDHPEGYGFPDSCDPSWTLAFCWDKAVSQEFCVKGGSLPLRYLPLASDPALFRPKTPQQHNAGPEGVFVGSTRHANPFLEKAAEGCPGLSQTAWELWNNHRDQMDIPMEQMAWQKAAAMAAKPRCEIESDPLWRLWVKSCLHLAGRIKRVEVVDEVLGPKGAVLGDSGWAGLLKKVGYFGPVTYGPGLRDVYLSSSFVLEVRQPQSHGGLSQRVFDASLCGRPVLAEWSAELEDILGGPERIFVFLSLEEALEARERCLGFPAEALKMAGLARKEVLSRHTFLHRARFFLECLQRRLF